MEGLLYRIWMAYLIIGIPLFVCHILVDFPKYIAQVVFWPIWLIVEIVLSTIRWIKDIKV